MLMAGGKRAGAPQALPPCPIPERNLPSWLLIDAVAPEEEKGTASEPAIPS